MEVVWQNTIYIIFSKEIGQHTLLVIRWISFQDLRYIMVTVVDGILLYTWKMLRE